MFTGALHEAAQQGGIAGPYAQNEAQLKPGGIMSAMQEMAAEVTENIARVENLRSSLGISHPECNETKPPVQISLLEVIRSLTDQIRRSNGHLSDVLNHINN